ncbi:group II intron maturase-specific domain-containing protein [Dyadobacter pollutisoli]|uniref:group II intron maturase-specific domain-containing protein n=1 Tax=Dyadobacter pollutisoli TaxID=2910158 RepID=UPI0035B5B4BA
MVKLKQLSGRSKGWSMEERLLRLKQVTVGWINYFALANARQRLIRIDEWLQSRLRMCIWKQWKKAKTRITNLKKLGLNLQKAYEWGNTRRGYWRTAHSPILLTTITKARLKRKGYLPLLETYTLRREALMNRRDTRPVRPVV